MSDVDGRVAPVLRAQGLCKRFGERHALRDVSFAAAAGELIAVIGPNGAGKTTLLSILAGAQPASAGSVQSTAGRPGWAPQQPALYSKLSVAENLRLFARLERTPDPEAAVARMLAQIGLAGRAGDRLESLSGGNRQRVNVALGLLSDPPVILLDEPSTALDPGQRERLWDFIAGLARAGTCVLFSTHIVSEAARWADRVLVLDAGRLLFDGSPAALARSAAAGSGAVGSGSAGLGSAELGSAELGSRGPGTAGSGSAGPSTSRDAASADAADFERAFVAFLEERTGG